ncbi:hypothetical protein SBA3_4530009 [Candidatus Sulfopaludibacter sp. SbA3]|nr:hypothetical protein SBA3_4530009 [Candidatus Sulfopaludibacter sp. SbA3]
MLVLCLLPILIAQSGGTVEGTVSDSINRAGLSVGDYLVSYFKDGYKRQRSLPRCAHHTSGETVTLKAEIVPLGAVSGRVLDKQGRPMPHVLVRLAGASRASHAVLLATQQTGPDGAYRFQKLDAGAYMIEAVPNEPSLQGIVSSIAPPESPPGERWAWANTYFPGVLERSQAGPRGAS